MTRKVLVVKIDMVIPQREKQRIKDELLKDLENGLMVLDERYTYEVVEIGRDAMLMDAQGGWKVE